MNALFTAGAEVVLRVGRPSVDRVGRRVADAPLAARSASTSRRMARDDVFVQAGLSVLAQVRGAPGGRGRLGQMARDGSARGCTPSPTRTWPRCGRTTRPRGARRSRGGTSTRCSPTSSRSRPGGTCRHRPGVVCTDATQRPASIGWCSVTATCTPATCCPPCRAGAARLGPGAPRVHPRGITGRC